LFRIGKSVSENEIKKKEEEPKKAKVKDVRRELIDRVESKSIRNRIIFIEGEDKKRVEQRIYKLSEYM